MEEDYPDWLGTPSRLASAIPWLAAALAASAGIGLALWLDVPGLDWIG